LKHGADNVALAIGQVVRAADFSFLDALGALEIMDPKTDSGMALEEEDENDISGLQSLLPEEVIWIMDQLLAREVCIPSLKWQADVDLMALWQPPSADAIHVHIPREFAFEFQRSFGERYISQNPAVIETLVRAESVGGGLTSIYPCSH